ncbi:(4Fe-4S)-binding protein [Foetidibacter luteolus]|uniref:(4Fe-4S)-binding protein n=1 Tax=Foetidibacter luteolus TaxID=2608880 RepID=UPI00129C0C75|nr:(4Fe-4S)-binding protein [Foetidibacter luteolus]
MPRETFKYNNEEVTVIWKPNVCIHSTKCWKGLGEVFDPGKKPWINMAGAGTSTIIEQVKKCPSGALSFVMNNEEAASPVKDVDAGTDIVLQIELAKNGPLLVKGACAIQYNDGTVEQKQGITALCRCGASSRKPFCDGSHNRIGFMG